MEVIEMKTVVCMVAIRKTRRGKEILLVRNENVWMFPGGKPKMGEGEKECLIRELEVEELPGIKLKIGTRYCSIISRRARKGDKIRVIAYVGTVEGPLAPDSELTSARWLVLHPNLRKSGLCKVVGTVPHVIAMLKKDGLL